MMTLPESRRARRRRAGGTLFSIAVHAAAIGGAVFLSATRQSHASAAPPERPRIIYTAIDPVQRPAPERRAGAPRAPAPRRAPRAPVLEWHLPLESLPPIPPVPIEGAWIEPSTVGGDAGATGAADSDGQGSSGGGDDSADAYLAADVERLAILRSPVVPPRYPESLRRSGVAGHVVLRFVVDTAGRVEPESIAVVESAHALFAQAAIASVRRLRFTAARLGDRPVRLAMELPFDFTVR